MIKRTALTVVATLVLLLPAAPPVRAASCKGASHAITLSAGAASPRSGTTATGITFSVRYASNAGCAPSSVAVAIAGIGTYSLASGGADYAGDVTFTRTMTLPPGLHAYTFSATGGTGAGEQSVILTSVNPDAVAISAPAPVPTPSPTPVAPPATPQPAAPPPATPAPAAPAPVQPPAPAAPSATQAPSTGTTHPTSAPTPPSDGAPAGSLPPSGAPAGEPAPASPGPPPAPGDEHDSWIGAPIFSAGASDKPSLLGGDDDAPVGLLLSVTAATGMLLAAILLARRRIGHGEPVRAGRSAASAATGSAIRAIPTITLSASAAGQPPVPAVRPLPPMRELIPPVNPALLDEDAVLAEDGRTGGPDEQGIPRWLRPSVREARFAGDRDHRRTNWG